MVLQVAVKFPTTKVFLEEAGGTGTFHFLSCISVAPILLLGMTWKYRRKKHLPANRGERRCFQIPPPGCAQCPSLFQYLSKKKRILQLTSRLGPGVKMNCVGEYWRGWHNQEKNEIKQGRGEGSVVCSRCSAAPWTECAMRTEHLELSSYEKYVTQ